MDSAQSRLHHLSPNQLRALLALAKSPNGVVSSTDSGDQMGKRGKPLGGIFSALSRQKINDAPLILPWGKPEDGHGLRWKLNTDLISRERLLEVVSQLLEI